MISHLWHLIKKEVRELLTPATVIPIVIMAIIFASIGNLTGGAVEDTLSASPVIGIINLDGDNETYSAIIYDTAIAMNASIVFESDDINDLQEGLDVVRERGAMALIVIGPDYNESISSGAKGNLTVYWNMKGTGIFSSMSSAPVDIMLSEVSRSTTYALIEESSDLDPENITSPIVYSSTTLLGDKELVGLGPETVAGFLQSQSFTMPMLIMIIIVMLGGIIISSMGQEKENKTLETLLTLPVNRTVIVSGKLLGSAIVGLVFAGIYMVGMNIYMDNLMIGDVDLSEFGISMGTAETALVGLMVVLAIVCALGICMILGAFAKNYKAAQSLTIPITFLALIPFFVTMFTDYQSLSPILQALMFAIPFTHPMMATNNIMVGNMELVYYGIAYLAIFALATVFITVRLYKSDILLTGVGTTVKGSRTRRRMRK